MTILMTFSYEERLDRRGFRLGVDSIIVNNRKKKIPNIAHLYLLVSWPS